MIKAEKKHGFFFNYSVKLHLHTSISGEQERGKADNKRKERAVSMSLKHSRMFFFFSGKYRACLSEAPSVREAWKSSFSQEFLHKRSKQGSIIVAVSAISAIRPSELSASGSKRWERRGTAALSAT